MRTSASLQFLLLLYVGCSGPGHQGASSSSAHHRARPEGYYITEAALRFELAKHSADAVECNVYSGYLLDCGEFTADLLSTLKDYKPPVIADVLVTTDETGEEILDKSTGKHIKVWRVDILDIRRNMATACVYWSSWGSKYGFGHYTLKLRRKSGRWEVVSERSGLTP
jgi:hypothetical protein